LTFFSPANVSESKENLAADPECVNVEYGLFHLIIDTEWESLRASGVTQKRPYVVTSKPANEK
jgi:hypothetical protein